MRSNAEEVMIRMAVDERGEYSASKVKHALDIALRAPVPSALLLCGLVIDDGASQAGSLHAIHG
jgi:hypothetical protein